MDFNWLCFVKRKKDKLNWVEISNLKKINQEFIINYKDYVDWKEIFLNFNIQLSIFFLAMIIIGGLGSIRGSLMGAAFMVLLPEVMDYLTRSLSDTSLDQMLSLSSAIPFIKEASIGLVIILFLIFEPNGLAYRWGQIRAWFKLYPFSY